MGDNGHRTAGPPPEGPRPWWDKALDPLRTEAAMFRLLLWVVALFVLLTAAVLLGRAVF